MSDTLHVVCPACASVNRLPSARLTAGPKCGKCKRPLFEDRPVELSNSTFGRHISRSDIPVVVFFWAPWCSHCRVMLQALAGAVSTGAGARFAKLNTEQQLAIAQQFVIRGGREIARQAGALDIGQLISWVQVHI